jgi:hypothetical protein
MSNCGQPAYLFSVVLDKAENIVIVFPQAAALMCQLPWEAAGRWGHLRKVTYVEKGQTRTQALAPATRPMSHSSPCPPPCEPLPYLNNYIQLPWAPISLAQKSELQSQRLKMPNTFECSLSRKTSLE